MSCCLKELFILSAKPAIILNYYILGKKYPLLVACRSSKYLLISVCACMRPCVLEGAEEELCKEPFNFLLKHALTLTCTEFFFPKTNSEELRKGLYNTFKYS